jgi:hypothetical protein
MRTPCCTLVYARRPKDLPEAEVDDDDDEEKEQEDDDDMEEDRDKEQIDILNTSMACLSSKNCTL